MDIVLVPIGISGAAASVLAVKCYRHHNVTTMGLSFEEEVLYHLHRNKCYPRILSENWGSPSPSTKRVGRACESLFTKGLLFRSGCGPDYQYQASQEGLDYLSGLELPLYEALGLMFEEEE